MAYNPEARALTPPRNTRLKELLMLLGCGDEIAPFDADARWPTRAGELIAKASSHQPKS